MVIGRYKTAPFSFFTGITQPVKLQGKPNKILLNFVTGVHYLPTNWKLPYIPGTEIQTLFTSSDGGNIWKEIGPVINSPPTGWNITGFRDPFLFPSPALNAVRNVKKPYYYATFGSGLKGPNIPAKLHGTARPGFLGPRIPLYAAPASNLTDWSFLGALWEPTANFNLGAPDVTGSYEYNFKTSGLFNIPIGAKTNDGVWFTVMGSESGNTLRYTREQWALWNRGAVSNGINGGVQFKPISGGTVDWGLAYAHSTWADIRKGNNRRVMWGWANEDPELNIRYYVFKIFGYAGSMTLPTELFVKKTQGVRKNHYVDGNEWIAGKGGAYTVQTLGIRPLTKVVETIKKGATQQALNVGLISTKGGPQKVSSDVSDSFILTAIISSIKSTGGIIIAQSPDNSEYTNIVFDTQAKTIGIRRNHSSSVKGIFQTTTHEGHFAPYITATDGKTEKITFTIVYNKSLLKVFVNDRFALTSRVYPMRKNNTGLSFFAGEPNPTMKHGTSKTVNPSAIEWKDVKIWKGLDKAWPKRPEDSSSKLRWDTAEQTGNYTWWAGW